MFAAAITVLLVDESIESENGRNNAPWYEIDTEQIFNLFGKPVHYEILISVKDKEHYKIVFDCADQGFVGE